MPSDDLVKVPKQRKSNGHQHVNPADMGLDPKELASWPTMQQVLKLLHVQPRMLRKYIEDGAIKKITVPGYGERFDPDDVEALIPLDDGKKDDTLTAIIEVHTEALKVAYTQMRELVDVFKEPAIRFAALNARESDAMRKRIEELEGMHVKVFELAEKLMSEQAERELVRAHEEKKEARIDQGLQMLYTAGPVILEQAMNLSSVKKLLGSLTEEQVLKLASILSPEQLALLKGNEENVERIQEKP